MIKHDEITVQRSTHSRHSSELVEQNDFGAVISDHMFISDYHNGEWHNPRVIPYADLQLNPATLALHYGQSVFEGMKAFRMKDGAVSIFRIEKHLARLNRSLERMCMPHIPEDLFREALIKFVETDQNWVPNGDGHSLYIRPFVFASEARFGVKVAEEYKFIIFGGPVGPYYGKPLKLKVETHFVRANKGGTGFAKCAGNYGASFYPSKLAREEGYDQVIWTDGREHQYIEESGTMNVMFMFNNTLVTPATSDSILDGVTRDSILTLANSLGVKHEERKISIKELEEHLEAGTVTEAFGAGTAAVVAPIEHINIEGKDYTLPKATDDTFMMKVKNKLMSIRVGVEEDTHHWNTIVK
jgi:branched-chain amino acid aminotransferase